MLLILPTSFIGCLGDKEDSSPMIDITIRNSSSQDVDWVKLTWEGPHVPGGIIPAGKGSTTAGHVPPGTTTATIEFVDKDTREPFSHEISLAELHAKQPNSVRQIIFRILSHQSVELVIVGSD